mgnify:CR=1 FL=1
MFKNKLISIQKLNKKLIKFKKNKKKIILKNFFFYILHSGHIKLLINSKKKGDILIVGLNSDKSFFLNKKKLPKFKFSLRSLYLSEIRSVDFVVKMNNQSPIDLLNEIRPHLHCKGGDYKKKNLLEYKFLKKMNIKIYIMPIKEKKISSSKITL